MSSNDNRNTNVVYLVTKSLDSVNQENDYIDLMFSGTELYLAMLTEFYRGL